LARALEPVSELTGAMEQIVEHGDLTQVVRQDRDDELGRMVVYFAKLVEKLREIPVTLGVSMGSLNDAIGALVEATEQQNRMLARQAASLHQTQVTAEEIRQISDTAAGRARELMRLARQAVVTSREGEDKVRQSVDSFSAVREQVEAISGQMLALNDSAQRIMDIVGTVKDFSDQSNILALNAGIEAMRAGEHGKGFSLVAREVRTLADQSLNATARVEQIMGQVTQDIARTVKTTQDGNRRIEAGAAGAKLSGEAFNSLAALSRSNTEMVSQIAEAVDQQNTGIDQIFQAVKGQNEAMDETLAGLQATQSSLSVLRQVVSDVDLVLRSFKV
jgi:methyl-accepting chemotaxis protein